MQDYKEIIQKLEEKGYREYPPTAFDKYVDKCWQKRFDDDKGKRYFIDAKLYEGFTHPHTGDVTPPSFEYEIYLKKKDEDLPIEMKFYAGWELEDVEEHVQKMFETGEYGYYELWSES